MTATKPELRDIPVTLISGALGVGKTTALTYLLEHVRPAGEHWAILVNEIGEVGIDGALLEGSEEGQERVAIKEVPGGCICCTSGLMFQINLTMLIQKMRPDRVLIEPTGVAEPGAILDMLAGGEFSGVLSPRATITLVDPRRLWDPRHQRNPVYQEQLEAADVLVANKVDLADAEELMRFEAFAREMFPPKLLVATTQQGVLDPAWLDLEPRVAPSASVQKERGKSAAVSPLLNVVMDRRGLNEEPWTSDGPRTRKDAHVYAAGWRFEATQRFLASALRDWLEGLESNEALPQGFLRVKGVLQTEHGWVSFNLVPGEEIEAKPSHYRRDVRVEILAPREGDRPDWATLHEEFCATFLVE